MAAPALKPSRRVSPRTGWRWGWLEAVMPMLPLVLGVGVASVVLQMALRCCA